MIGILTVDGWSVTFCTAAAPLRPFIAVPNITAHQSTASVRTSYYSIWHYNYLYTVKSYDE